MGTPRVNVVGAGPLGAATSYWLARHGCEVRVYDAGAAGGEGASRHSGGMLRCIDPDPVLDVLSALGTRLLNRWEACGLPGPSPVESMCLWWLADDPLAAELRARLQAFDGGRTATLRSTRDAALSERLLDGVRAPWALHDPQAGLCDVRLLVRSLLWGARRHGARLYEHCPIGLRRSANGQLECVAEPRGLPLAGDLQVLATGQGLPTWLPGAGGLTRRTVPQVQVTGLPPLPGMIIDARSATYIRPLASGDACVGWSGAPLDPDQPASPSLQEAETKLRELAWTLGWPQLPGILSLICGSDAYTGDFRPLLQWSDDGRTCWASGLSGRGLKYALLLGACIADQACERLDLAGPGQDLPEIAVAREALSVAPHHAPAS